MGPEDAVLVQRMDADELRLLQSALKMHAPAKAVDRIVPALTGFLLGGLCIKDLILKPFDWFNVFGLGIALFALGSVVKRYLSDRRDKKIVRQAQDMINRHRGYQ